MPIDQAVLDEIRASAGGESAQIGGPSVMPTANPDAVGRGLQVARQRGGNPLALAENPQDLDAAERARAWESLVADAPKTAAYLTKNPIAAAVSNNDWHPVGAVEKAIFALGETARVPFEGLMQFNQSAYGALSAMSEVSTLAMRHVQRGLASGFSSAFLPEPRNGGAPTLDSLAGPLSEVSDISSAMRGYAGRMRQQQQDYGTQAGNYGGETGRNIASGFASAYNNAITLPVAATTAMAMEGKVAATAAGLLPIGVLTAGGEYAKARDAGLSVGRSAAYAGTQGAVEMGTEALPFGVWLSDVKASMPLWKIIGKQLVAENVEEQVATAAQDANEWLNLHPEKTLGDYMAERPNAALQTAIQTTAATLLLSGPGSVALRASYKDSQRAAAAINQRRQDAVAALSAAAAASRTLMRDGQTFQDIVAAAAENGPVSDVYLDAQTLAQSGVADRVAAVSPAAAEQMQAAIATGGQVRIPIAEYTARIAPDQELSQQMIDHLRFTPEDMTLAEARDWRSSGAVKDLEDVVARIVGEAAGSSEFQASKDRVKQQVLDNLNALGRFRPQVNELNATLIAARSAVRAAQMGMTPEEFFNQHLLKVVAQGQAGEQALNQAPPTLADVEKTWSDAGISHAISEKGDVITLSKIVVPDDKRGSGMGTQAMEQLLAYADATGKHVTLTPSADFGGNKKRLTQFYKRFGFVENKGKNRAFSTSEGMYRQAQDKVLFQGDNQDGADQSAQALAQMVSDQPTEADIAEAKRQLDEQLAIADKMIAEKGGLFAPNGEPSKLTREQWAMVRTANFKNWFGEWENAADSRGYGRIGEDKGGQDNRGVSGGASVLQETYAGAIGATGRTWRLDTAGEPRVFFHGTKDDFTVFDLNHDNRKDHGWLGTGVYLASDVPLADSYARLKRGYGNPHTMDLFANVRNPYVATIEEKQIGRFKDRVWADELTETLSRRGHDGVVLEYHDGTLELVAFNPNQVKSATGNIGTFNASDNILYQPDGGPGPVKRGWFSPATNTIALLKNADLSTFLHESAHWFFETDIKIASDILHENAVFGVDTMSPGKQQILRDVSALLKWHGIEGDIASQIAAWQGMDFEERRTHHERTAEAFERYLMEGKAPNIELQSAFQHFRQWLLDVYKSVKQFLERHPEAGQLNDEVRAVFDRMLATDEEIKLAEQARSMIPLFESALNAGMTPAEFADYQRQGDEATKAAIDELQAKGLRDMKWLHNARSRMLKKLQAEAKVQRAEVRSQVRMEVMEEPVYRAWNLLTAKMTEDDRLPGAKPKRNDSVDPSTDSLFEAVAKLGGMNRDEAIRQWGLDPKSPPQSGLFGKPVWRAKDGGKSLDWMVERLTEEGYLTPDENGKGDIAELEDRFMEELRGRTQFSVIKRYDADPLPGQGEDLGLVSAARIDRASLDSMEGLPQEVIDKLVALGMTAKTGGIHPDVLSEVLPGWTSGDELVRALAEAKPLKEEVESRTDQVMLEAYGEMATQEAIERAADMAIHNDARERFLSTEYNALAKAAGERRMLLSAAKEFASKLIGRQRIRDLRPGMYTAAEARAAKAAAKETDLAKKAAEKRNQVLNTMAARETYRAQEDVSKGLRYLKKFQSKDIRKRISGDYVDQIERLMEAVDLRKRSLTDIDRRTSFGAFVRSQIEKGVVPVMSEQLLPPNLRAAYTAKIMERDAAGELVVRDDVEQAKILADYLDMAEARSYKDMTVDEFRGLIESVKQIEHLGRKKKSLLTARDGKSYEQKRDELVDSVIANSDRLPSRMNRTVPDTMAEKLHVLKDFKASLKKVAMMMRLIDGNKDGGPMWDFFIRSANERGDWETEMISQSTEALTKALAPALKLGMRGKGVHFPTIGRSLNREQRIGLALNVGNEGNLQRLLDGEGWSFGQIRPVLESLTAAEWNAVQEVWDHLDSLRPMIAAIERRVNGVEPEWVQPMQFTVNTADGQALTLKGGYYPVKYDAEASRRTQQLDDAADAQHMMGAAFGSSTTRRSFVKSRSEAVVGRPLLLSMNGVYSGVQDVIHDLAWREWLLDATKMMNSTTLDNAIRDKYGAETVRMIDSWIKDIAAGGSKPREWGEAAVSFIRRNVAAAGLAINVMNAVQNVTGLTNSIERVGAGWIAAGQKEFLSSPKDAAAWVDEKSSLMRNRAKTQFRDLNELRNVVENGDTAVTRLRSKQFILMTATQRIVDIPTWIGAYRKAEAEAGNVIVHDDGTIDDSKAVAMADQAVIDAQGSGMLKDLAAIERGGAWSKLFTVYYSYMNTTYNLAANRVAGAKGGSFKQRGAAALHVLALMSVPVVIMAILKAVLTPGDDPEWDDPEKIAKKLANDHLSYLIGLVPLLREAFPVVQPFVQDQSFGYQGPSGLRMFGDAAKFSQQASQGEFDDGFRKAAVSLSGSLLGMPAAQINRTWTGAEAMADDKTENPMALLFGYQEKK